VNPVLLTTVRISGMLLIVGLIVEAISLRWNTAPSFLLFMFVGGFCFAAGFALYFFSLLLPRHNSPPGR
jgi:hypothetical protein